MVSLGSGLIELGVRSKQLINDFLKALTGGNMKKGVYNINLESVQLCKLGTLVKNF